MEGEGANLTWEASGASRGKDSQAPRAPRPPPTRPLTSPLAWGGAVWGMCRPQSSPQHSSCHPTAIMCLSAPVETEVTVCWLPTQGTDRPSERQDCLGQPPRPQGCHPTRHNKPRAGKGTATLEEQGTSETPDFKTPRSQGQDRKQGLWGKPDHSELRAHFKGPWDRTSKTLQPKRLSGKLVVKSREHGVRMWVQNSVWDISWLSELGQNYR